MFTFIKVVVEDLLNFFFPNLCAACSEHLVKGEEGICLGCMITMPVTSFEKQSENPVIKQFWGKVPIANATAYCHFTKGGRIQKMIHQLKYEGRSDVGVKLGQLCGYRLLKSPLFAGHDVVIPIPLHPHKLRFRGYNQAASFGKGLAEVLMINQSADALQRTKNTASQTNKHRLERAANVANVFEVIDDKNLIGKKILLVDDVITTGSTLIAAAETLLRIPGVKVSIVTIAFARL